MMESRAADLDNTYVPRKDIYADVSACLFKKGFPFNEKDVDIKWHNLIRQYKTDLARKEKSGAYFERTPVFDQMERIIGHRHDIKPKNIAGSGLKRKTNKDEEEDGKTEKKKRGTPDAKRQMMEKLENTLAYFRESDERFRAEREEARKTREEHEERKFPCWLTWSK